MSARQANGCQQSIISTEGSSEAMDYARTRPVAAITNAASLTAESPRNH